MFTFLQSVIHQQLPYVPLWYEDHVALVREPWQGYRLAVDGNYDGLLEVSRGGDVAHRN